MSNNILGAFSPIKSVSPGGEEEGEEAEVAEYEDSVVTSPMIVTSAPGSAKENRKVFDATTPINPRKISRVSPRRSIAKATVAETQQTQQSQQSPKLASISNLSEAAIRRIVREELEEVKEIVQRDIRNLHVDLLKGNTILERSMERSMSRHLPTVGELLKEIEELRNENKRLRLRLGM